MHNFGGHAHVRHTDPAGHSSLCVHIRKGNKKSMCTCLYIHMCTQMNHHTTKARALPREQIKQDKLIADSKAESLASQLVKVQSECESSLQTALQDLVPRAEHLQVYFHCMSCISVVHRTSSNTCMLYIYIYIYTYI
jgi:hypothetical protein